jgi:hypothetical protein
MICPVCKSTGHITVRLTRRIEGGGGAVENENVARACPMGCKPVASDRLKGREMSIEALESMVGKRRSDYKRASVSHSIEDWYGFGGKKKSKED